MNSDNLIKTTNINTNTTTNNSKPKSNKKIFQTYISVPFVITLLCVTSWIFGNGNIQLIRYWYVFSMCCLLGLRISEFVEIKYHHFLVEMCYYVNILTMGVVLLGYNVRIIYPFTHGPLLFYCIIFGDAPIPDRLTRVLTFFVHCYSALVTRKIFWTENYNISEHLTWENFYCELVSAFKIYLFWFLLYSVYLLRYSGNSDTMIKYIFKLDKGIQPNIQTKLLWLLIHLVCVMITCSFGILFRYNYMLNNLIVIITILSSIYQIGKFYYKHK